AERPRAVQAVEDLSHVAVEISNRRIDLREPDADTPHARYCTVAVLRTCTSFATHDISPLRPHFPSSSKEESDEAVVNACCRLVLDRARHGHAHVAGTRPGEGHARRRPRVAGAD